MVIIIVLQKQLYFNVFKVMLKRTNLVQKCCFGNAHAKEPLHQCDQKNCQMSIKVA